MKLAVEQPGLAKLAREESQDWVERLCAQLVADGREIRGGWPGTMSEARRRVAARLTAEGRSRSISISADELESVVQAVYMAAKKEWLSRAPRP